MSKKYLFILLLCSVLFIAGCSGGGSDTNSKFKSTYGGVESIFLPARPPTDKLYSGQGFQVGLELWNSGNAQTAGTVCVSDTLSSYYGGIETKQCKDFSLYPAEVSSRHEKIYFPDESSYFRYQNIDSDMNANIYAELTYTYQTKASPQFCITAEQNSAIQCNFNEVVSGSKLRTTPAPIAVTKVTKQIIPEGGGNVKLMFDIELKPMNNQDKLVGSGDEEATFLSPDLNLKDFINFKVSLKGVTDNFDCWSMLVGDPKNPNEKSKVIRCETSVSIGGKSFWETSH